MVAKRGIMFEFDTALAPGADKALAAIEKRVDALQKRMHLTLSVAERGARGTNGSNGSGGATSGPGAAVKAAEQAAQARERAAEKSFRAEARLNRMAEAAVEKRERAEARAAERAERDAKRAADVQIRETKRAEAEKQKELSAAARRQKSEALREQRSDKSFWGDFEKFGADRAKAKADAEKKSAAEQRKADRERQQAERESELAARRQAEAQNRVREGVYGTVHAFGQLTRAAAQFGLVGQRDMMKVLDTIFAVEGSINALQGVMGAARAVKGIRAAGGLASLGGAASGIGGAGGIGLGTVGLAGAGATALLAGAAGLAGAAIDRNRGVAGNVGGAWDTVGTRLAGASSSISGFGLRSFGRIESMLNSPYGLSKQEQARRTESVLGNIANSRFGGLLFGATGQNALIDMRAERVRAEREFRVERQRELDATTLAGFNQQFGHAHAALEFQQMARERSLILRENRSPLTREGPLLADLRGRRGALGSQISSLQELQGRVAQERATAFQEGGLQRGGEFDTRTAAQLVEYERQIRDLMTQQASINREIQRTGIEGLKQQLDLRKQMAEGARGRFETALGRKQGLEERLGAMTPGQVAAIARIKQKAERGESLSLHEIERLDQGDERSQFLAGEAKRRRFRNLPESIRGTLGDVEGFKFGATQGSMGAAAEGRDKLQQDIINQERAAGIGRPPPVMVDAKYTNEIKVQLNTAAGDLADLNTQLANELMPKIETAFQENVDRFADLIMERVNAQMKDAIRRQNQNQRSASGD